MISRSDIVSYALLTSLMNLVLALVKVITGLVGNSYALVADGIESASDIVVSFVTWLGFSLSLSPPDENHPFGHGKIESLAGFFSGVVLIGVAVVIAVQSILEILTPHHVPEWYTLPVLLGVVGVKEFASRRILKIAKAENSRALEGEAWHHRSDALTSGAALIGISVALIGGEDYAAADDWGALFACVIILLNGSRIIIRSFHETIDGGVDPEVSNLLEKEALVIDGVRMIEKCMVRKSGIFLFSEMHVQVDPQMSVELGHKIGHQVKAHLMEKFENLQDVAIHLEPYQEKPEDTNEVGDSR